MAEHLGDARHVLKNFRILWDNCVIGLAVVDARGNWLQVNPAFCDIVEYTESELLSRTVYSVTHPDDAPHHARMLQQVEQGTKSHYVMSKRLITKTGDVVWITLRVDRVVTDGEVVHFLSQVQPYVKIRSNATPSDQPARHPLVQTLLRWLKDYWPQICGFAFVVSLLVGWMIEFRVQQEKTELQNKRLEKIERLIEARVSE